MNKPEYLKFVDSQFHKGRKTRVVNVLSTQSNTYLGQISWYSRWRQYTFRPHSLTVWNNECLNRISEELSKMNRAHRELLRKEKACAVE